MRSPFMLTVPALLASGAVFASSPSIGLATANGRFQANSAQVAGNATLFEGSLIETDKAPSRLRLNDGSQVLLGKDSRARVYQRHLVLEKGGGQLQTSAAYPLEARSLRVASMVPGTVARVNVEGGKVLVAALKGKVQVMNASGVLVARMEAGWALSFDPQAGATGPTSVTGLLQRKNGIYLLVDETTGVTLELRGTGLERYVGKRVEIMGAADPAGPTVADATQAINVSSVKQLEKEVTKGSGSKVAIIGGIAAAGTLGALAATGSLFSDDGAGQPPPPSR